MNISSISGTFNILLVGALLCVLMLLVLTSLLRSRIAGLKEWGAANLLAGIALVLYAFGRELPALIAYELTNTVYAAAMAMILAGFQRFFGRRVRWGMLGLGVAAVAFAIAWFHYRHDSYGLRTLTIAVFQSLICIGIMLVTTGGRDTWRSRYPYWFTQAMAVTILLGHVVRSVVYLADAGAQTSLLQPSPWNLFFLSLGNFVLPVLTFGAVMMVHDRMMAKAEHAANRDFLTGAWSRRAFFELAERELVRAKRNRCPLALLLLDVDHFKRINDTVGHAAGDKVLIDVVAHAEEAIRDVDYLARIGGEEFAVLLPETGRLAAVHVAERLRKALERSASTDFGVSYTVSIGMATWRDEESFHELMSRADAALYVAKEAGRNRVVGEG